MEICLYIVYVYSYSVCNISYLFVYTGIYIELLLNI